VGRVLSGRHAENLGASKAFIVTDPGVRMPGWTAIVEKSLKTYGIDYMIFDCVTENPKDHEVMSGVDICRNKGCDLIISVGGGSPMDCAKGIGVMMGNPGNIRDYEGVDMIPNPGPPLIFIPTTAGSSADVSQFAIITKTPKEGKIAIISKMVIPDIALIDPETTITMPPELTAATGMDALCHSFEAYVSNAASPLTDMAALSSAEIIADNLYRAFKEPNNIIHRDKMMTASLMAGLAALDWFMLWHTALEGPWDCPMVNAMHSCLNMLSGSIIRLLRKNMTDWIGRFILIYQGWGIRKREKHSLIGLDHKMGHLCDDQI